MILLTVPRKPQKASRKPPGSPQEATKKFRNTYNILVAIF